VRVHSTRRFAEIALGCRLHTVGARTQINTVEIDRQNLFFGKTPLDRKREQHFLDLACSTALVREEHVFGELLGNRRPALHHTACAEICEGGTREPLRIDAEMAVEAPVLGRQYGHRQPGRHFLELHKPAEQIAVCRDRLAGGIDEDEARTALEHVDALERRQREPEERQHAGTGCTRPQPGNESPFERNGEDAPQQARTFSCARGLGAARLCATG